MRIGFSAVAALLILAGASLNATGHGGGDLVVVAVAGLLAVAAGAAVPEWRIAGPTAAGALLVALLSVGFHLTDQRLPVQLGGLLLLALAGVTGITAYRSFSDALRSRLDDVHDLNLRVLSPKVRGWVQPQSWWGDFRSVWMKD